MEEFTPDAVAKVSKACTSICMWVRAMYVYHNVALQVGERMQSHTACTSMAFGTLATCTPQCSLCLHSPCLTPAKG